MGNDDESSNPRLCSEVAGGVTRNIVCLSESRMREICLSGSMSGNRKQGQVKPDCGGRSESPTQQPPGDYSYCACSRLYSPLHQQPFRPDSPTHRSGYPLFAMGLRPLGPESPSRQQSLGDGPWRLTRHRGFTLGLFQQTSYACRSRRTSVASRKNPRPSASGMTPKATAFHTSGSVRAINAKAIM